MIMLNVHVQTKLSLMGGGGEYVRYGDMDMDKIQTIEDDVSNSS